MDTLTVPGSLDSLGRIRDFVDRMAQAAGLERKAGYRLRLAVDEIATNIVHHGYDEANLSGEIHVKAQIDDTSLTVFLEDTGVPFDPTAAKSPDNLDDPLEERPIGGLGIFLTVTGVDGFRYERLGDRNLNVFVMRRPVRIVPSETA